MAAAGARMNANHAWWQRGVIYHVYPRSFLDDDGDGVGDLRGITRGLAYLAWLGVDALWISPIYPSPMADFGYDVSDHSAIDPRFGALADFDALVDEAHRRGLRVILGDCSRCDARIRRWPSAPGSRSRPTATCSRTRDAPPTTAVSWSWTSGRVSDARSGARRWSGRRR
jgi:alpha-glucosidase